MNWEELKDNHDLLLKQLNRLGGLQIARECGINKRTVARYAHRHGIVYDHDEGVWTWEEAESQKDIDGHEKASELKIIETQPTAGTKVGFEEKKPAVYEKDGIYHISNFSGTRSCRISKDKLRKIYKLYTGKDYLTINQLLRHKDIIKKPGVTRADFMLIKSAFGLTHDSASFIPDDLLNRDMDEMVKETVQEAERRYFVKLEQQQIDAAFRELNKYREQDFFINKIHDMVTDHFIRFAETYQRPKLKLQPVINSGLMLETSIVDLHLSKLCWEPETGQNFDRRIAEERFMNVIYDVVNRAQEMNFEKILFAVGNDFFNFDNLEGATTRGTRQDNDTRWKKMYIVGSELLIKGIDVLAQVAPVDVFLVPGNHDFTTSFYAMMHLYAWYRNDENVRVDTDPKTRKYREFGKCLIGFTHGNLEKNRIYGNMQVEVPEAWGRTKYREFHAAHFHREKVNEKYGVIVRNLSSITARDAYHYEHGYLDALPKSQSFIWHKEKGLMDIMYSGIGD